MKKLQLALALCLIEHFGAAVFAAGAEQYEVRANNLRIQLGSEGRIHGALLGEKSLPRALSAETVLAGCRREGEVAVRRLDGGGVEFRKRLIHERYEEPLRAGRAFLCRPGIACVGRSRSAAPAGRGRRRSKPICSGPSRRRRSIGPPGRIAARRTPRGGAIRFRRCPWPTGRLFYVGRTHSRSGRLCHSPGERSGGRGRRGPDHGLVSRRPGPGHAVGREPAGDVGFFADQSSPWRKSAGAVRARSGGPSGRLAGRAGMDGVAVSGIL